MLTASSQHNLYDIYLLLCIQCWAPNDGQINCLKHVKFYSKNKFDKLLNLFGFIIRRNLLVCLKRRCVFAFNSTVLWDLTSCKIVTVSLFTVCRSVHLCTFKWINQLDAAINYRFIVRHLDTAQHVSGIPMPIIRSLSTAAAASVLP